MIYFTFVGNHDDFDLAQSGLGPLSTIFMQYKQQIDQIYIYVTPSKANPVDYQSIARKNAKLINSETSGIDIELIPIDLPNPVDFDLVYPVMLDQTLSIIEDTGLQHEKKLINITSGTPTMTTCWVLLAASGMIENATLVQSFETRFAKKRGSSTQVVNLNIDDFPNITSPAAIKRQLTIERRQRENLASQLKNTELDQAIPELIGKSDAIRDIKDQIIHDIDHDTQILIIGERGTGKQVAADVIWRLYHKKDDDKLITFNCGALAPSLVVAELFGYRKGAFTGADQNNPGILARCDNRMLFLDEIGNLPREGQHALLRFIKEGEYREVGSNEVKHINAQIIAATNKNIDDTTLFAQDLKDRFDEIIQLPPLRTRKDDIPLLVKHFLSIYSKRSDLSSPIVLEDLIVEKLYNYGWPGNVRELEKWISRLCRRFDGGTIKLNDLPERMIGDILSEEEEIELPELPLPVSFKEYIEMVREKARRVSRGNMAEVDRLLGQKKGTERQRQFRKK